MHISMPWLLYNKLLDTLAMSIVPVSCNNMIWCGEYITAAVGSYFEKYHNVLSRVMRKCYTLWVPRNVYMFFSHDLTISVIPVSCDWYGGAGWRIYSCCRKLLWKQIITHYRVSWGSVVHFVVQKSRGAFTNFITLVLNQFWSVASHLSSNYLSTSIHTIAQSCPPFPPCTYGSTLICSALLWLSCQESPQLGTVSVDNNSCSLPAAPHQAHLRPR